MWWSWGQLLFISLLQKVVEMFLFLGVVEFGFGFGFVQVLVTIRTKNKYFVAFIAGAPEGG